MDPNNPNSQIPSNNQPANQGPAGNPSDPQPTNQPSSPQPAQNTPMNSVEPAPSSPSPTPQPADKIQSTTTDPSTPQQHSQPQASNNTGSSVMPGFSSVNAGLEPPSPKKSGGKKAVIIAGVVALLLGISAVAFYFGYWTRSDVVYSRFKNNMSKIVTSTMNTNVDLIKDVGYKASLSTDSSDTKFSASAAGRIVSNGTDNTADINLDGAVLNLAVMTISDNSKLSLYFKYKGIAKFYEALQKDDSTSDLAASQDDYINGLIKYDDKWISYDASNILGDGSNNEGITQQDYKSLAEKLVPVFNQRYIGLDKNNSVFSIVSVKSQKVAGLETWAYEIKQDDNKFNAMLDELSKATDATNLSAKKKEIVKQSIESSKLNVSQKEGSSRASTKEITTIWIDKLTASPVKFSTVVENSYDNELYSKDEFVIELTKASLNQIVGSANYNNISYNGPDEDERSNTSVKFSVDNKSKKITTEAKYDPSSLEQNDIFSFNLQLEPTSNTAALTKPNGAVTLQQVLKDLGLSDSLTLSNQSTAIMNSPLSSFIKK